MEPLAGGESLPDLLTEKTFAELASYAERLAGTTGTVTVGTMPNACPFIEITPHRDGAWTIRLSADQWVVLGIGSGPGGRWELDYTDDGRTFARKALEAVIRGRAEERLAFGRSEVALTFEDGSIRRGRGYRGCVATLVPLPGWTRWGKARRALPYE